ncbi:hypothetical protein ES703_00938 [subsurface metagenome]|nr:MAG: hypothetical protein E3J91_00610 [Hadesarchaea archaeon]
MPKKHSQVKSAATIKRDLEITERELRHITEFQWIYAKRMLRFGFASWIFGLLLFLLILVVRGLEFLGRLSLAYPLLIIAIAVPVLITAFSVRRFNAKIKRFERIRKLLLTEYETAILKRASALIKKK